jgi:isocitrate lyase
LFLQGFISENGLKDTAAARKFYENFLKQYPNHKLASDVKISLNNMGKTPDELIREFEKKNSADSLSAK